MNLILIVGVTLIPQSLSCSSFSTWEVWEKVVSKDQGKEVVEYLGLLLCCYWFARMFIEGLRFLWPTFSGWHTHVNHVSISCGCSWQCPSLVSLSYESCSFPEWMARKCAMYILIVFVRTKNIFRDFLKNPNQLSRAYTKLWSTFLNK